MQKKWISALTSLIALTMVGCSSTKSEQKTGATTSSSVQIDTVKTVKVEESEIQLLSSLMDKHTLLDNMIGNIGYNIQQNPGEDTIGAMQLFSNFFLNDMYQQTEESYAASLIELKKAEFDSQIRDKYLENLEKYDQKLEEGRAILLNLTKENGTETIQQYTEWVATGDIQVLGSKNGVLLMEMLKTKYSDEEATKAATQSMQNSMEKYGDPTDYTNLFGTTPENSEIQKIYDELNL